MDGDSLRAWLWRSLGMATVGLAVLSGPGQDTLPLRVVAEAAGEAPWAELYLPADAPSLLHPAPPYVARARRIEPRYPEGTITSYVSSPGFAWLCRPLAFGDWRVTGRVVMGGIAAVAVLGFERHAQRDAERSGLLGLGLGVLALFIVVLALRFGQTSPLFALAGFALAGGWLAYPAAAAVGVLALAKAFPLAWLPFLALRRQWPLVAIVLGVVAVPTLGAAWTWGAEPFVTFLAAVRHLNEVVVTDWNAISWEAAVTRPWVGTSPWFARPFPVVAAGSAVARLGAFAVALGVLARRDRDPWVDAAVATGAVLFLTPLAWTHYLTALVVTLAPMVLDARRGWRVFALVTAFVGAMVAIIPPDGLVASVGTLAWTAGCLGPIVYAVTTPAPAR